MRAPLIRTRGTPKLWDPLPEFTTVIQDEQLGNIKHHDDFFSAACAGTLPAVSWVIPNKRNSEHPPASIADGQAWVTSVVNVVMRSPDWKSSAIFVSWDDWAGFYDHVVPPRDRHRRLRHPRALPPHQPLREAALHRPSSAQLRRLSEVHRGRFHGRRSIDPRTDGRPDSRPDVREDAPQLGDLIKDFDFSKRRSRMILRRALELVDSTSVCLEG